MYKKEDFLRQLNDADISPDAVVHIHSSLRSVGEISGGGDTLLDALLEYFRDGLVTFPAHTWAFTKNEFVLDLINPDTCTGTLTKLALKRKDAFRSVHPTHSVVAFGKCAKEFVKGEENSTTPTPKNGCYGKLFDMNGFILLLGVDQSSNTFLHYVEEDLGLPNRFTDEEYPLKIRLKDGTIQNRSLRCFTSKYLGPYWKNYTKLEDAFRCYGAVRDFYLGDAKTQICSAVKMKEIYSLVYEERGRKELFKDAEPL